MKILILNTYVSGGGAAVAAGRMLKGLTDAGVDARMLVLSSTEDLPANVRSVGGYQGRMTFLKERLEVFRAVGYDRSLLFRFSSASYGIDISSHPWVKWADVIHLHWVQQGFLSLSGLEQLFALPNKSFFWSLHDLWPITGGCHIPYYIHEGQTQFCQKFLSQCKNCPLLRPSASLSERIHMRKASFPYQKIRLLGVSNYVTDSIAEYLRLFPQALQPLTIPNSIDPRIFYPKKIQPERAKKRILFVAARVDDPVKGLDLLHEAVTKAGRISEHFVKETELYIVGHFKKKWKKTWPIPVIQRHPSDISRLALEYREANLTLSTSRFETFGQTLLESLASGTPVLAFDVGGISDLVREGVNGELVPAYDTDLYADRLIHLLYDHKKQNPEMIADSIKPFHITSVVSKLIDLYRTDLL